jgi:hypothetical protein
LQVDGAKGIEPQTRKLFEVARMRKLPIFTLVNKVRAYTILCVCLRVLGQGCIDELQSLLYALEHKMLLASPSVVTIC